MPAATKGFDFDRLVVHPVHVRLVVKRVDLARPAVHVKEDHRFGFGRKMGLLRRERVCPFRLPISRACLTGKKALLQQPGESDASKARPCLPEPFPAGPSAKVPSRCAACLAHRLDPCFLLNSLSDRTARRGLSRGTQTHSGSTPTDRNSAMPFADRVVPD